ncbi:MAG: hypothetical protein M3R30_00290 [Candidatus Eremiobacteraeota bacterium]|nr:hypothetical protein [Candidatus Eremiobacteraeota bacterium]
MLRTIFAAALLIAQASASPAPTPTPDTPVYVGNPATHYRLESRPLGVDPDGTARWLVVAHFLDAQNRETTILANSDLSWDSDRGHVQWQNRMRFGSPAAMVTTTIAGPIILRVRANKPALGAQRIGTDTRTWRPQPLVAGALGPHMIQIGIFPRTSGRANLWRITSSGRRMLLATLPKGSSTYRDAAVQPNHRYAYVETDDVRATHASTVTPPELPSTSVALASGKGMWLYWSLNPLDDNYYGKLDPDAMVAQATKSGLHYVEIRTAYGAMWQIPPAAKPKIDALIDGLAAHGIVPMGWTVPREATFEDVSASVRTTQYRTTKGTRLLGIAVDFERGDDFMGADPNGLAALWQYEKYLREAVGSKYLIVATVEDPSFEHLDESKYPFREIARYADVLQPMAYWRMMRRTPTTPDLVKTLMGKSVTTLLTLSGRALPVSIGGQTTAEGRNGYPPAAEITASLDGAKAAGAIGVCYFDWKGTQPYQWDALASYTW